MILIVATVANSGPESEYGLEDATESDCLP